MAVSVRSWPVAETVTASISTSPLPLVVWNGEKYHQYDNSSWDQKDYHIDKRKLSQQYMAMVNSPKSYKKRY